MSINIKRIYEPYSPDDGYRILVDRLCPRGVKKESAHIDEWLKEVAPSTELRKWFDHDPDKWKEFQKKYHAELKGTVAVKELKVAAHKHKVTTLLFAAKDPEYNQATVLQKLIK